MSGFFCEQISACTLVCLFFFFQAEDGIRDLTVTGVQTCALPIFGNGVREAMKWGRNLLFLLGIGGLMWAAFNYMTEKSWTKQAIGGAFCFGFSSEIGRGSCRGRG